MQWCRGAEASAQGEERYQAEVRGFIACGVLCGGARVGGGASLLACVSRDGSYLAWGADLGRSLRFLGLCAYSGQRDMCAEREIP